MISLEFTVPFATFVAPPITLYGVIAEFVEANYEAMAAYRWSF